MTTAAYQIGDLRVLSVQFRDSADPPAAYDPDVVNFEMVEPDGTVTPYTRPQAGPDSEIVKDAQGDYHVEWMCAKAGRHHVRWAGTGNQATAEQSEFYVARKPQ